MLYMLKEAEKKKKKNQMAQFSIKVNLKGQISP